VSEVFFCHQGFLRVGRMAEQLLDDMTERAMRKAAVPVTISSQLKDISAGSSIDLVEE